MSLLKQEYIYRITSTSAESRGAKLESKINTSVFQLTFRQCGVFYKNITTSDEANRTCNKPIAVISLANVRECSLHPHVYSAVVIWPALSPLVTVLLSVLVIMLLFPTHAGRYISRIMLRVYFTFSLSKTIKYFHINVVTILIRDRKYNSLENGGDHFFLRSSG